MEKNVNDKKNGYQKVAVSKEKITKYYSVVIRIDVRIPQISRIRTDFFWKKCKVLSKIEKKSVPIGEIREIRTSIRITMFRRNLLKLINIFPLF
jgi:hypothetical protein